MGSNIRKAFAPAFKVKVALEAAKGVETTGQLASRFSVHPTQIGAGKRNYWKVSNGSFPIRIHIKKKRIRSW